MGKIYAPWREKYVSGTAHSKDKKEKTDKKECIFCKQFKENNNKKYFIIKRFDTCALIMNRYPYNAGHLMVLPFAHRGNFVELTKKIRFEISDVINIAIKILEKTMHPEGFNVGFNSGIAGGGGIPSHFHVHIIPRWSGDTNFLSTIGKTRVISSNLNNLYKKFRNELKNNI